MNTFYTSKSHTKDRKYTQLKYQLENANQDKCGCMQKLMATEK
jgi:hypothetical protein